MLSRPPHPVSRFVTIGRNVPLAEAGCVNICIISDFQKAKYFSPCIWTADSPLKQFTNFGFSRRQFAALQG